MSAFRRETDISVATAPRTEVFRPRTLPEAVEMAARGDVTLAAGCTDLYPATTRQVLTGPVLDLTGIAGFGEISETADGWRIGAGATWTDVLRADLPPGFDGLKAAAREVGSVQIQNAGTVGGNICNASPAADGVPPLLVLGAEVELASVGGVRRMPVEAFLLGPRKTALAPGEILSAIICRDTHGRGSFAKLGARRYLVISIAMVAARIVVTDGVVTQAALAVGSCSATARRLSAQERALIGVPVGDVEIDAALVAPALDPIGDVRADAAYRLHAATELVRRAVVEALP